MKVIRIGRHSKGIINPKKKGKRFTYGGRKNNKIEKGEKQNEYES